MSKTERNDQLRREFAQQMHDSGFADDAVEPLVSIVFEHTEVEESDQIHEAVKLDQFGKGESTNFTYAVKFRLGKTMEALLTAAINVSAALSYPWAGVLGVLLFVRQLKECTTVEISERGSQLTWALWKTERKPESTEISISDATKRLQAELTKRNLAEVTPGEIEAAVSELERLGIVERTDVDFCKLVEFIQVNAG